MCKPCFCKNLRVHVRYLCKIISALLFVIPHSVMNIPPKPATRTKKLWPKEDTDLLINLYATYGVPLWNTFIPENKEEKSTAMQKIVSEMQQKGHDESEVKQKLNYIRIRYKHEVGKIRQNPQYKPTAYWFKKLHSFLKPHVKFSESSSSRGNNTINTNNPVLVKPKPLKKKKEVFNVTNSTNENVEKNSIVSATATSSNSDNTICDTSQNFMKTENVSVGVTSSNVALEMGPNSTVETSAVTEGDNAFDMFGKSVAAQLKVFPRDVAVETQFKIQAILTDQTLLLDQSGRTE